MSKKTMCCLALLFATVPAATGCTVQTDDQGNEQVEGEAGVVTQPLYVDSTNVWDSLSIPVCFTRTTFTEEMDWIRLAIKNSWEKYSHVRFTGWKVGCTSGAAGLHVRLLTNDAIGERLGGSHVDCLGDCLDGDDDGVNIVAFGRARADVERTAVHEFGHALSFAHEQNRDDAAPCSKGTQGHDGDTEVGAYDRDSVMNYCDESPGKTLSSGDIAGLRKFYWGWQTSYDGNSGWNGTAFASSDVGIDYLRLADFNADGISDVFYANGSDWWVSYSGNTGWTKLAQSSYGVGSLKFGHFTNDWNEDVFLATGSGWYYSSAGVGGWTRLSTSSYKNVALGDFNGDTWTDVFVATGEQHQVSWGGNTAWQKLNSSKVPMGDLGFADFNGDGITDVFRADGNWYISWGGTTAWEQVNTSDYKAYELSFADFNGDGSADVLRMNGSTWYVSYGARGPWTAINSSAYLKKDVLIGNFDGDAKADIFRTRNKSALLF